jgi:uncharacterized membrane protein
MDIAAGIATLLALDLGWIALNAKAWQRSVQAVQGGAAMRTDPIAATLAYVAMVIGLVFIVLPWARRETGPPLVRALKTGGLFGFVVYAIFDATNAAIFEKYDRVTAVLDVAWGTTVFTLATFVALLVRSPSASVLQK